MNFDHLPLTKLIETTDATVLEDVLLALGFEQKRQWYSNTFSKDDLTIVFINETTQEKHHYALEDPHLFLQTIQSAFRKVVLVIQGKTNTGGSWVIDPKTQKRTSRNLNDLQEKGVTYDDVMHPRHVWKHVEV